MDDLQFRRSIYADPNCQDPDILHAIKNDPAKKQFSAEMQKLENDINAALKIDVPADLQNKLILRQTFASHRQQKRKNRVHLALAASVAIAIGLSFQFMQFSSAYSGLGDYALAHVYHEEHYFDNHSEKQVSLASVNDKMSSFDASFTQLAGKLIAADYCRFDGVKSLHLVFQGKENPVTVFIVPDRQELIFDARFQDKKFQGESKKFGNSNVIIVADKQESLQQWQTSLSNNIKWSI